MDLIQRIDRWGNVTPDRPAFISGGRSITYRQLIACSNALASYLLETLGGDCSPIVVLGHKETELPIAYLGCVKAGHPYVPTDTIQPPSRVERIVEVAHAPLILTPERVAEITSGVAEAPAAPAERRVRPDDPFYVMFTSGSTGEPKGVPITLANLTCFVDWMVGEQSYEEGEVFLNQVPYSFDVSLMDTAVGFVSGGTIFSITREQIANPRRLYPAFAESNVTTWVSTPSFAQVCLVEKSFGRDMLPRLRRFLFCGETLAPEVAAQLLDRFPGAKVWNTYGPTETTVATTSIRVDRDVLARYSPLPIGSPMPGSRVVVLDETGRRCGENERGELVIAGPHVSPGYLGRPDLTERVFFEYDGLRAYRTGDWGRERDGLLFCEGRKDNQVKLHGYRVELGDVESHLRGLASVQDAVVLPVTKNGQVDSLAAFVILRERRDGPELQITSELKAQLVERIPSYMLPRRIVYLDTFPMTTNGKADRRKLAEALT
ncbi:MAG: D-alanine--poly(phosphoribitol) ligase subunit DltA [Chloroflexi bacterium]|nr:D-alanine--poly(phosphoribitol) ligase subunit DltA [Chloroflexota bacterium]